MTLISDLRSPKVDILGRPVAIFDLSMTIAGGYILGKYLDVPVYITVPSMFALGYTTHKALGIKTAFNVV
jgi:hypothetical protein